MGQYTQHRNKLVDVNYSQNQNGVVRVTSQVSLINIKQTSIVVSKLFISYIHIPLIVCVRIASHVCICVRIASVFQRQLNNIITKVTDLIIHFIV